MPPSDLPASNLEPTFNPIVSIAARIILKLNLENVTPLLTLQFRI